MTLNIILSSIHHVSTKSVRILKHDCFAEKETTTLPGYQNVTLTSAVTYLHNETAFSPWEHGKPSCHREPKRHSRLFEKFLTFIIYTVSTKTQSQRIFSILLFSTDKIFIKFGGFIPESTQDTTAAALPMQPYPIRFILMISCRTETETGSTMQEAKPFDCCCIHQSVPSPSLSLLSQGS